MLDYKIIYLTDDGITSLRCGVGAITSNFIESFPAINDYFKKRKINISLSVISFNTSKKNIGYRIDLKNRAKSICRSTGGKVYLIYRRKIRKIGYFDFSYWKKYNEEISKIINRIADDGNKKVIVLANDTIFANVHCPKNVIFVWIPHSLAMVHSQTYVNNAKRLNWEKEAISRINSMPDHFIGYISPFVKSILTKKLKVKKDKAIPFQNGFCLKYIKKQSSYSKKQIDKMLIKRGIDTKRPIILTFARADEYKGLEHSLRVMTHFTDTGYYYGVIIASRFSNELIVDRVQENLRKILSGHKNISAFFEYEFELPKYLLRYAKTQVLLNLPNKDFCPLIPFEAELIGNKNLQVINSNIACFNKLVINNHNGFLVDPYYPKAFIQVRKAISIRAEKKKTVIKNAKKFAQQNFDIITNYIKGFECLFEKEKLGKGLTRT
ncbi:glycosyltransferase [Patescibacteria group bacterium]|nr:glycosyltransferase [Patescibacteria group bacterium]MBU1075272.1 glycosyltransferase [Patescibacteria group bacterium]MBU1952172.1 glycosyltransferase [Patescibacteria group bacterium]MBU2236214.1 glycosyltransferase [Patescibacteria group bacterium]